MLPKNNLSKVEPFYESAQVVINNKASNRSRATLETDEPESASQSSSKMLFTE
ncbi:22982_t:CDS:2 [Gigaspora margarita]|uniref:22982_t:CDS:1 n=1 Tax=Gigaspora margarita TaxID=4874 RepID=A0ABN7UPZ0_GIGMA|nr:22982_t:CDS:2 [Gigaspora margarita]